MERGPESTAIRFEAAEWALIEVHAARSGVEPEQFVRDAVRARMSGGDVLEERGESARRARMSAEEARQEALAVRAERDQALRRNRDVRAQARSLLGETLSARRGLTFSASSDFREVRPLTTGSDPQSLDQWLDAYVHPEDRADARAAIECAVRSGDFLALEHRVLREDGSAGSAYTRAVPMLRDDGTIAEWLGVSTTGAWARAL